jgi:hypothetical protein
MTLSKTALSLSIECNYAECRIFIVMLNVIMLSVVLLTAVAPLGAVFTIFFHRSL